MGIKTQKLGKMGLNPKNHKKQAYQLNKTKEIRKRRWTWRLIELISLKKKVLENLNASKWQRGERKKILAEFSLGFQIFDEKPKGYESYLRTLITSSPPTIRCEYEQSNGRGE